jgi:hypothetical protein
VEDQHIYLMTLNGLQSFGNSIYNNELLFLGAPIINPRAWEVVD